MSVPTDSTNDITLTELEQAINYWRGLRPSTGEEHALSPEVDTLATAYALMIFHGKRSVPRSALEQSALQLLQTWHTQRQA